MLFSSVGESQRGSRLLSTPANRIVLRGMIAHPAEVETAPLCEASASLRGRWLTRNRKFDQCAEMPLLLGLIGREDFGEAVIEERIPGSVRRRRWAPDFESRGAFIDMQIRAAHPGAPYARQRLDRPRRRPRSFDNRQFPGPDAEQGAHCRSSP